MLKYFIGIEIEINHHCNLTCSYCPNAHTERISKGLMSIDQFTVIMEQLKDINYEGRISYHFYNEPTLHPQLVEFVRLSKLILPKTKSTLFTNGLFITLEKFQELRKAGIDFFTVTKHKDIKKIAFEETYSLISEVEKKHVLFLDHSEITMTNRGGLVDEGYKLNQSMKRTCLVPSCSMIVTVNGNVLTCYEDFNEKNIMGNVFQEHLKDIWIKPEYVSFREDLKKGFRYKHEVCKTCNNMQVLQ